jgi:hypothetical protein
MTTFHLKIIAIVTMVIDHVGLFFFPHLLWPRLIGRIAFPLFAWLIANGAKHTRDIRAYGIRLLALALVSQIPFTLANLQIGGPLLYLNVVFTLFLGLLAIYAIQTTRHIALQSLAVFACAALANLVHADYGAAGVLSIVAFYVFFDRKVLLVLSQTIILGLLPTLVSHLEFTLGMSLSLVYIGSIYEIFSLAALGFILAYNGQLGIRANQLFYYFYPLQYVLLYIGVLLFG